MRKSLLLLAVLALAVLIPLASAASWQNQDSWTATLDLSGVNGALTIFPGAGSGWNSSDYFFKNALANRTNFKPLHALTNASFVVWFRCSSSAPTVNQYLLSQGDNAVNNNFNVYLQGNEEPQVYIGNSTTQIHAEITDPVTLGHLYRFAGYWETGGLLYISLYDADAGVLKTNQSTSVMKGALSCNSILKLGNNGIKTRPYFGSIYTAILYNYSITAVQVAQHTVEDVVLEDVFWYWLLNEGSGIALLPNVETFMIQDGWSETLIASAPYTPSWNGQDYWTETLDVPAAVVDISPFLPPWFSLLGMVLVPTSLSYVFIKKRVNGDIEFNDIGMAILLFFVGLALLVGSVV